MPKKIHVLLSSIIVITFAMLGTPHTFATQTTTAFPLRLKTQPFNSMMCKKIRPDEHIRIGIANRRDLLLRPVPNQLIPQQFEDARKKSYVYLVTLEDLTNGVMAHGAIAFNTNNRVIFSDKYPQGIPRETFIAQLPASMAAMANQALDTFLQIHPILNAAIDGCRPYPSHVTYGSDDEFEKIYAGRLRYRELVRAYHAHPKSFNTDIRHEKGTSGGFYDPRSQGNRVSYHAMNPLYFFRPCSYPQMRCPR